VPGRTSVKQAENPGNSGSSSMERTGLVPCLAGNAEGLPLTPLTLAGPNAERNTTEDGLREKFSTSYLSTEA